MSSVLSNEKAKKLANQIMIDLTDEEAEKISEEFETIDQIIDILDVFDTDGVAEMVYPFEDETTFLREDEVKNVLSKEDALKNAPKVVEGQIVVPKVVK